MIQSSGIREQKSEIRKQFTPIFRLQAKYRGVLFYLPFSYYKKTDLYKMKYHHIIENKILILFVSNFFIDLKYKKDKAIEIRIAYANAK